MPTDFIRDLYHYNAWANGRILDQASHLSPEKLREPTPLYFGSVLATLAHILWAQELWLERWQDRSPQTPFDPSAWPDLSALRARWDEVEAATQAFVAARTDADLARVGSYRNFRGQEWHYPLWQQMVHQVNHATQHRAEAALYLSQWGCSPGSLDFLYFVDAQAPKSEILH